MTDKRTVNNFTQEERKGKRLKREFRGNIPAKTAFEHAHLKAYLKGKTHFRFGFKDVRTRFGDHYITERQAVIHEVEQLYYLE